MSVDRFLSLPFLLGSRWVRFVLPLAAAVLVCAANMYVFTVVPNESVMGPVQRIFYFHVSSAVSAYLMIALLLLASLAFLKSRKSSWDAMAHAAASIALLFCTIVLCTGMIWGHSAWNTWWRWEPRLVSFLLLWLLMFSYGLFRSFTQRDERQAVLCAVLAILAAVLVPVIVLSVKFMSAAEQLHPQVMENRGLTDIRYVYGLLLSMAAVVALALWLFVTKLTNVLLARRVTSLEGLGRDGGAR